MTKIIVAIVSFATFVLLTSCGEPNLTPSPSTVSGGWVNEIPGQKTILLLKDDGGLTVKTNGSALGPLGVVVVLDMIAANKKWSVNSDTIAFHGDREMALKIRRLTSNTMTLESLVSINGGRKSPIKFLRIDSE